MSAKREREEDTTKRVLYSYWRSSCSWRVRLALEYKQLSYEYKAVNLLKGEDCDPEYVALNPAGVPTYVEDGVVLTQSLAILDYLEERYPDTPLLPRSFKERAQVRSLALLIASGIQPIQNLGILQKIGTKFGADHKVPWANEIITEGLQGFEDQVKKTAGKFCFGDNVTFADFALIPQIYNATRFNVDLTKFPTVQRIMANLEPLEFCKRAHPDAQPDAVKQ